MPDSHYTPAQLRTLQQQADSVGDDRMHAVHHEWAALFEAAEGHRQAGLDPASLPMQGLATRAEALVREFTGGDAGIRRSLTKAVKKEPAEMYAAWGVDPDLGAYFSRAMAALHAE